MQNKPNLLNAQINASSAITMNYEQLTMNHANKYKPNSKPIKANQSQSKPIKANTNPISQRVKLMQSLYLQRIMKNNADRGYEKTKPKQTQLVAA